MEKLILIGAGGYAKSVLDSVDYFNYQVVGFIDEYSEEKEHLGYPILGKSLDDLDKNSKYVYFISIGNNLKRKKWYDKLVQEHKRIINIVDRSAIISPNANIGNGCFVGKMAIINSNAYISDNSIINTKASVINGDVKIGEGSFIGSCSVIIGQLSVGNWSTVGAGAVVIRSVEDGVTVAGVPAKVIKNGAMLG